MEVRRRHGRVKQPGVHGRRRQRQPPLAGYAKFNLHSSYDITDKIQVYGLIDNLFDTRYGLFGNFFDTAGGTEASLGEITFNDPRTVVPGAPFAVYGGMKFKF